MPETKLALMERLRKEKRWAEADEFREATRARLRSEGMRREQAREEAWRLTAEKFPPVVKAKAPPTTPIDPPLSNIAERIEAVNPGIRLEISDADQRELLKLAQSPGAWSVNFTEALDWVLAQARTDAELSPTQAGSVMQWLLWMLYQSAPDHFFALTWSDYGLRHGLKLSSILWPKQTNHELRLRHQFIAALK